MRISIDRNFLRRSFLLLAYIGINFFLTKLFSHYALSSPIVQYYKYYQLLVTYTPITFFIFSIITLIIDKKSLIIFDFVFYLLNIPFIFIITSWKTMGDPFVVLRFFFLLNLYIKIIPFLFFLFRMIRDKRELLPDRKLIIFSFLISLVFFSSLAFLDFSCRKLSGDEPHYLLVAHSLLHDFDFELLNNYLEQDYLTFYPDFLSSRNVRFYSGWKILSQLGIGFPILLLPGYAILGRLGAQLIICIITSLIIVNLLYILDFLNSKKGSFMIFIVSFFSSPFLIYSRAIYPEMFIALLIIYMVRLILTKSEADKWFIAKMTFLSIVLMVTKLKNFSPVFILLVLSFKKFIP
ncbi:hypothetical protein KKB18_07185, partial [bacterium]|nr:hypothetical protein [bacterium]